MNPNLVEFTKNNYPKTKSDLFAVFIERTAQMINENGFQAMITQHAWMFLDSFKDLRVNMSTRSPRPILRSRTMLRVSTWPA